MSENKGAVKYDKGKPPVVTMFMHYFPRAIRAVSWVSEFGARKYEAYGYINVEDALQRYANAGGRHLLEQSPLMGGLYDEESGLADAAQEAWNAMAKLELMLKDGVVEEKIGNERT